MWQDIILKENIIKASPDIIDLIEEEDYVNGKKVDNVALGRGNYIYIGVHRIYESEIKSIVTKEQFKQMSYKVGE